jgi:hypothetical protein
MLHRGPPGFEIMQWFREAKEYPPKLAANKKNMIIQSIRTEE